MTRPGIVVLGLCVLVGAGIGILVCVGLRVTGILIVVVLVAGVDVIVVDGRRIVLTVVRVIDVGVGMVWA